MRNTINGIKSIRLDFKLEQRLYKNAVYMPESGCLEWTLKPSASGYAVINVNQIPLYVHRLMYALATGKNNISELDHICKNTVCVAPYHLREVSHKQNSQRQKPRNIIKGVYAYADRTKPFWAHITVNRKRISLGYFSTRKDAIRAYNQAALRYHFDPILNNVELTNG